MARKRPARSLRVRAFAKINLGLHVVARRPDGFHQVRTRLQTIQLHDTLTFVETSEPFAIECDDPECPTDRANLVWQAAERVWRAARRRGSPSGVRVRIEKKIPMAAGLGGGSSDAAAALRACARLWRVKTSRLPAVAATRGADVPFLHQGGKALGGGPGDSSCCRRLA
jgi:4-diphosphocytidyl-2-C-methyl-D-erythritol kinase